MSYFHESSLDFFHHNQIVTSYPQRIYTALVPWDGRIMLFIGLVSLVGLLSRYIFVTIRKQVWAMKHSIINEMRDSFMSDVDIKIKNVQSDIHRSTNSFDIEAALNNYITQDEYKRMKESIINHLEKRIIDIKNEIKESVMNDLDKGIVNVKNELSQYVTNKQFINNLAELNKKTETLRSNMINNEQLNTSLKSVAFKSDIEILRKDISYIVLALGRKLGSNTSDLEYYLSKPEVSHS